MGSSRETATVSGGLEWELGMPFLLSFESGLSFPFADEALIGNSQRVRGTLWG